MDWLISTLIILLVCILVYICSIFCKKHIRPKFPVQVCCWFCHAQLKVPYGNRNCWDCPECDQYNGFSQDGDYNKAIPSQYSEYMNFYNSCQKSDFISGGSVLCTDCNANQLLKISQLANFVPWHQESYDEEIDNYQKHLEQVYKLCDKCEFIVQSELQKQDAILEQNLSLSPIQTSDQEDTEKIVDNGASAAVEKKLNWLFHILNTVSIICSFLLTAYRLRYFYLSYIQSLSLIEFDLFEQSVYGVSVAGLLSCFLARFCIGKNRLQGADVLACFLWIILMLLYMCLDDRVSNAKSYVSYIQLTISVVITVVLSLHRNLENVPKFQIRRLSLDMNLTDTASIPVTSASEVAEAIENECLMHESSLDDALTELGAFSLGPPTSPKRNSGMFSNTPLFTPSPVNSYMTVAQQLRRPRPVISPAKLDVSYLNRSPISSGFNSCLEKNSFLSTNFSNRSGLGGKTSAHHRESFVGERSSSRSNTHFTGQQSNVDKYLEKLNDTESSFCLVDSTTKFDDQLNRNDPWWKQPGLVGFIIGASLVGNIALAANMIWAKS